VLPNTVDCLVLLLAAGAVGAIFSSTSPDMGTEGIVERYSQLKPKILICYSEVSYGGKKIDLRPKLAEANRKLGGLVPELKYTLVLKGRLFEGHNV
jgi:acetoacetyl-CoA synthetase